MRCVFDTSVLVDYLRNPNSVAADALLIAADRGRVFISVISLMELYLSPKSDLQVQKEVTAIQTLCERLNIRIVQVSKTAQDRALVILREHRSCLGRNAVLDSLIIGTAEARRAYAVTCDKNWFRVSRWAVSPEKLVQMF